MSGGSRRSASRRGGPSPVAFLLAGVTGALLAVGPLAGMAQSGTTSDGTSTGAPSPAAPSTTTVRVTTTRPAKTVTVTTTIPPPAAPAPVPPSASAFSSAGAAPPVASAVPFMTPFPVVRIAGSVSARGARIRMLSVRAPAGAAVVARCTGRGCRGGARLRASGGDVRLRALQRRYRVGATLEIFISSPAMFGKYTRFVVRRAKSPVRADRCLAPDAPRRPVPCPALS